jgi:hypothetical protein
MHLSLQLAADYIEHDLGLALLQDRRSKKVLQILFERLQFGIVSDLDDS